MKRDERLKKHSAQSRRLLGEQLLPGHGGSGGGEAKYQGPIQALACHVDTVLSEKRANQTIIPGRGGLTQIVGVDRAAVGWHTADCLLC